MKLFMNKLFHYLNIIQLHFTYYLLGFFVFTVFIFLNFNDLTLFSLFTYFLGAILLSYSVFILKSNNKHNFLYIVFIIISILLFVLPILFTSSDSVGFFPHHIQAIYIE